GARRAQRASWFEELQAIVPPALATHFNTVRDQIEGPVRLNVLVGRCREWAAPGVMVLGDAAHPMAPIRAQGINVALRDAIVAANEFVPLLRDGAAPSELDAAASRVQAEREPEIRRSQTLQHRDTRGLNSRAAPLIIGLAKVLGPRMGKYAWAKRAWLDQQKDLRFGSTEVALRV
ncbi:MAG: FAD-dependent monooxygenase, partial [Candidatus Hydrogenedentales bacterium]